MAEKNLQSKDKKTADAFASSWNNLPLGSVYTKEQFEDWMAPLKESDVRGKRVLELGCGNGSLMVHMASWQPAYLLGVDLGDSIASAEKNLSFVKFKNWKVAKNDLTTFTGDSFDLVYCIGVLHHLKDPKAGFDAMVRNAKPGGRFHAWVYAREGNGTIVYIVDPIRKVVSGLPWWFIKYCVATPFVTPFFFYAKLLYSLPRFSFLKKFPLYDYSLWIAKREFSFFRHVAFDQLVTPQTTYIQKETIESWLKNTNEMKLRNPYIIMRNGNSWKFGGERVG